MKTVLNLVNRVLDSPNASTLFLIGADTLRDMTMFYEMIDECIEWWTTVDPEVCGILYASRNCDWEAAANMCTICEPFKEDGPITECTASYAIRQVLLTADASTSTIVEILACMFRCRTPEQYRAVRITVLECAPSFAAYADSWCQRNSPLQTCARLGYEQWSSVWSSDHMVIDLTD